MKSHWEDEELDEDAALALEPIDLLLRGAAE